MLSGPSGGLEIEGRDTGQQSLSAKQVSEERFNKLHLILNMCTVTVYLLSPCICHRISYCLYAEISFLP